MLSRLLQSVSKLSNKELVARVKWLVSRELGAMAELIAHLVELDQRRLFYAEGYPSLFLYCVKVLYLSEHAAYARIQAARFSRRFPVLLDKLADQSLNLTTLGLIAPHLTPENHLDLIDQATRRSKRQVEELIARIRPQPEAPSWARRLPAPASRVAAFPEARTPAIPLNGTCPSAAGPRAAPVESQPASPAVVEPAAPVASRPDSSAAAGPSSAAAGVPLPSNPPHAPAGPTAVITPLAPERYKIQFTAGAGTYLKLRRAQNLLRHQVPDGSPPVIFDRALTTLLTEIEKRRFAATLRPRSGQKVVERPCPSLTRHIPADVKRQVWQRDGGRCAFVTADGRRCGDEGWLEFHHVRPHALGGQPTADNLELRCRAHNQFEAGLVFGPQPE